MRIYTTKTVTVQTNEGMMECEQELDPRLIRWEKKFLEFLLQRETHSDGRVWFVPARDGSDVYAVYQTDVGWAECTCPSFEKGQYLTRYGVVCKHTLLPEFVSRCTRWHASPDGFAGILTPESTDSVLLELRRPPRGESTTWELRVSDGEKVVRHSIPEWLAGELRGWYVGVPTWLK